METLMAVAAKIEVLMASIAVALLITTIALRGMFRAVRAAGAGAQLAVAARQNALKARTGRQEFALAPVRAGHRQISLRAR
ncbi:MAG TPA: hypothetical protein VKR82_03410 [Candidatus Acidoferrales bacterium]|nr:hypothetical protein [Candidatus Acidoferrales bacterium]